MAATEMNALTKAALRRNESFIETDLLGEVARVVGRGLSQK
jgi:hypothetical protein